MFIRFLDGHSRFCLNADGGEGSGGSGGGGTQTPAPAQPAPAAPAAQPTGAQPPASPAAQTPPVTPPAQEPAAYKIPDAYKDKPWSANIKSEEDLYKQFDGMQELIGKKTIQPIDYTKATPEEIAAHHAKLAPQDTAAYKFAVPDDPTSKAVGAAFQKAGINEFQGQEIIKALSPFFEQMQTQSTSEEGYMKLSQAAFGDNYKTSLGRAEATLKEVSDDTDKKVFDDMPNEQRIAVDKVVNKLIDKHAAEVAKILKEHGVHENGAQGNGGEAKVTLDITAQRADLRAQISAISARPHTQAEKQALIEKLNDTYKQK
jgi:hypothetical protein